MRVLFASFPGVGLLCSALLITTGCAAAVGELGIEGELAAVGAGPSVSADTAFSAALEELGGVRTIGAMSAEAATGPTALALRAGLGALLGNATVPSGVNSLYGKGGELRGTVEIRGTTATISDAHGTKLATAERQGNIIEYRTASGRLLGHSRVMSETRLNHFLGPNDLYIGYDVVDGEWVSHYNTRGVYLGRTQLGEASASASAGAPVIVLNRPSPSPTRARARRDSAGDSEEAEDEVRIRDCSAPCMLVVNDMDVLRLSRGADSGWVPIDEFLRMGVNFVGLQFSLRGPVGFVVELREHGRIVGGQTCSGWHRDSVGPCHSFGVPVWSVMMLGGHHNKLPTAIGVAPPPQ